MRPKLHRRQQGPCPLMVSAHRTWQAMLPAWNGVPDIWASLSFFSPGYFTHLFWIRQRQPFAQQRAIRFWSLCWASQTERGPAPSLSGLGCAGLALAGDLDLCRRTQKVLRAREFWGQRAPGWYGGQWGGRPVLQPHASTCLANRRLVAYGATRILEGLKLPCYPPDFLFTQANHKSRRMFATGLRWK